MNHFCFFPLLNEHRGKSYLWSIGWKGWPTGTGFVLSVVCFPCSGTEDGTSKVVEAAASVVETESSVMAVFSGSETEDSTSKVVEAAASVVAVLMLNSGVSVVDTDESTLWSTFVKGSATWLKDTVALSFCFWTYP